MSLPLENIKVLDFTHLLPGELTASVISDLGADITRVEKLKPGLAQFLPPIINGESLYFWSIHRDEKRIALDLKNEKAIEIVHQLVKDADVLIENFRPGVMGRLGLGFGNLHKINPKLVYCSISAYGQNTTFNQRPAHDLNIQAEAGVLHICRQADGTPLMPGALLSDFLSATMAALSIVSGILERHKTGKGRHLDISMFDSLLWVQTLAATANLYLNSEPPEENPVFREQLSNYNVFKCKDSRYIAAAPLEPQFWQTFCKLIERPDLLSVIPFGPNSKMCESLDILFAGKTQSEWLEVFKDSDCCVSPVNTVAEAVAFLPTQERNLIRHLIHPKLGSIPQMRTPIPFTDDHKEKIAKHDLGASSAAVLKSLGYADATIKNLIDNKVIPATEKALA